MKTLFHRIIGTVFVCGMTFFASNTHANVDQVLSQKTSYTCENGTGILTVTLFGSSDQWFGQWQGSCLEWWWVTGKESRAWGCTKYSWGMTTTRVMSSTPLLMKKFIINHAWYVDTTRLMREFQTLRSVSEFSQSQKIILEKIFWVNPEMFAALGYTLQNVFNISGVSNYFVPWCGCPPGAFTGTEIRSLGTYIPVYDTLMNASNGITIIDTVITGEKEVERGKWTYVGYILLSSGNSFVSVPRYHFIVDTLDFKPLWDGIPEACSPKKCESDGECRLTLERRNFTTSNRAITIPVLSTNGRITGSGIMTCIDPPLPSISCTAGSWARVIAPIQKSPSIPYRIEIPENITRNIWTCTVLFPETACQREKREVITITGSSACIPMWYEKPTCDISLTETRFPLWGSTSRVLYFTGITDTCQVNEYIGKMIWIVCTGTGYNIQWNLLFTPEYKTGTIIWRLSTTIPFSFFQRSMSCTLEYPSLQCGIGGAQKIIIGDGGGIVDCGNGRIDPGEQCDLGGENGKPNSWCSNVCTIVGSPEPQCASAYSGRNLQAPLTEWQCSVGTPFWFTRTEDSPTVLYAWSCNSGGKSVSCRARYTPPYCGDGRRDTWEECDPQDTTTRSGWWTAGCSLTCTKKDCVIDGKPVCIPTLSRTQVEASTGALTLALSGITTSCTMGGTPTVTCTHGRSNEIIINTLPSNASITLPVSVMSQSGTCTLRYPDNPCASWSTEMLRIVDAPRYITGVTITEKAVCFQIIGSSGKPIRGMQVTVTLSGGTNQYIRGPAWQTYTTGATIVEDRYCVDPTIIIGWGWPGGPVPGVYPITFCTNIFSCATTQPWWFITVPKKCIGFLEVLESGKWSRTDVLYDKRQTYRVQVTGQSCELGWSLRVTQSPSPIGGSFSGIVSSLSSTWAFSAAIERPWNVPPNNARWLRIGITYTTPGGVYAYGLTERDDDWNDTPLSISGTRMLGVRVIGNTSWVGSSSYNINSESNLTDSASLNLLQNRILQNVSLLLRNTTVGTVAPSWVLYYDRDVLWSEVANLSFKTLIIRGNLTLNQNIPDTKWIIVLKDAAGNRWNVIVWNSVTRIKAILFVEWMFRWESTIETTKNPDLQLVLLGVLYSRNTIGWSANPSSRFIYPKVTTTDTNLAFMQDLNTIRNGNGGNTYKDYSDPFIIDYDQNIIRNPPPGFEWR